MSRHQRLSRPMRSLARVTRRAKKERRQQKYPAGRPREYLAAQLPLAWLEAVWGHRK